MKVGDRVFKLNIGNDYKYVPEELTEVEVLKIGRKYFTVVNVCSKYKHQYVFCLDTFLEKTDYSPKYKIYETPQKLKDEKEERKLCNYFFTCFDYGYNRKKLPLESLRKIAFLIDGSTN